MQCYQMKKTNSWFVNFWNITNHETQEFILTMCELL